MTERRKYASMPRITASKPLTLQYITYANAFSTTKDNEKWKEDTDSGFEKRSQFIRI